MKLRIAMDDKTYDVRLRDRLLAEGKVTKKEVNTYLSGLSDEEGNYEVVTDESETEESSITEL